MIKQLKYLIEKIREDNRRCPKPIRCCAVILTFPYVLLGTIFITFATSLKHLENYMSALLKK